jgi:hypothetical protein
VDIREKNSWRHENAATMGFPIRGRIARMEVAVRWLAIFCFLLPTGSTSERRGRIDLNGLLASPATLSQMVLRWDYPPNSELYLYGDGRLALQAYPVVPDDPDSPFLLKNRSLVPTCSTRISTADIKALLQLMIERHFFDLPEKSYVYMTAAYARRNLELHTIAVDNGKEKAERTFGVGKYQGQEESFPPDFAAIEQALAKIRDSASLPSRRPCGVEPGIKIRKVTAYGVSRKKEHGQKSLVSQMCFMLACGPSTPPVDSRGESVCSAQDDKSSVVGALVSDGHRKISQSPIALPPC